MIAEPSFYAAAIPAVILMGLSKGGFAGLGLLALPLMALVASPVQAAAIMLPILLVQDVVTVWAFRRTWSGRAGQPATACSCRRSRWREAGRGWSALRWR